MSAENLQRIATIAIRDILRQLEKDTGQTVVGIELQKLDITHVETGRQLGKQVIIYLEAKDGWL